MLVPGGMTTIYHVLGSLYTYVQFYNWPSHFHPLKNSSCGEGRGEGGRVVRVSQRSRALTVRLFSRSRKQSAVHGGRRRR